MRKALAIIAAALGLLTVAVLAVEAQFGTWFRADPLDQLSLVRDSTAVVSATTLYPGGTEFIHRRDHWGFRATGLDPAKVTILTVGGDTTSQTELPEQQTWQAVMERELAAGGLTAVVANAGLDGQSTQGALRALKEWFPRVADLHPRFVLYFVGVADADPDGAVGRGDSPTLWQPDQSQWLRRHSILWRKAQRFLGRQQLVLNRHPVDFAAAQWTDQPGLPGWKPADMAVDLTAYRDRLRMLAQATHAMGAVPVFMTQARGDYRQQGGKVQGLVENRPDGRNGVDQYRILAEYNQATRAVCRDEGLLCLDLARELTFEPGDFYDYLHNTPQGAEKIGRWVAGKLAGLV